MADGSMYVCENERERENQNLSETYPSKVLQSRKIMVSCHCSELIRTDVIITGRNGSWGCFGGSCCGENVNKSIRYRRLKGINVNQQKEYHLFFVQLLEKDRLPENTK